jgi:hypothetical protein
VLVGGSVMVSMERIMDDLLRSGSSDGSDPATAQSPEGFPSRAVGGVRGGNDLVMVAVAFGAQQGVVFS